MARLLLLTHSAQLLNSLGRSIVALTVLAAAASTGWTAIAAHEPTPGTNSSPDLSSPPVVQLFAGWNNVSYMGLTLPLPDALNDARSHVTTVWQYVAATQEWRFWREGLPPEVASLALLERGGVYFVHATQGGLWTQPLAPLPSLPEPEPLPVTWEVIFNRSARGLGLSETIRFDAIGTGAFSRAGDAERAFTVGSTALAEVDQLLRSNDFYRSWPSSAVGGCGSCYLFEITIRDPSGGRVTLQADDWGLSGALSALVEQLSAILQSAAWG